MRRWLLPLLVLPSMVAFAQQRSGFNLAVPSVPRADNPYPSLAPAPAAPPRQAFQPAPLPNRDYESPGSGPASNAPTVGPSLFTRRDEYRGEGFSRGSTSQSAVEQKVKPGAGFSVRVPFAPN